MAAECTIIEEAAEIFMLNFSRHMSVQDIHGLQSILPSFFANICNLNCKVANHILFYPVFIFFLSAFVPLWKKNYV